MKKYSTLLLDADNTIFDFTRAEANAIEITCKKHNITFSKDIGRLYSEINDALWKRLEKGEVTRNEIKIERFRQLKAKLSLTTSAEEMAQTYIKELSLQCPIIDGAEDALKTLSQRYSLYIVTNGNAPVQRSRMEKSGLSHYFKGVFISEELGCPKPEKQFFDKAFEAVEEKDRSKICIIGDSMSSDILGGINAGIDTCWFLMYESEELYAPTYKARSFEEILKIF